MTAIAILDPLTGKKSYKPSPSPDQLLDNPDDPRFKVPALYDRVVSAKADTPKEGLPIDERKRSCVELKSNEPNLTPPYPDLQKPTHPSENADYLRKVCANAAWERDREAAELLVDCAKRTRKNQEFVAFQKTSAFQKVFGNKKIKIN